MSDHTYDMAERYEHWSIGGQTRGITLETRRITLESVDEMRELADRACHSGSVGDLFQLVEDLTDIVQAVIDGNGHIDLAGGYARLGR